MQYTKDYVTRVVQKYGEVFFVLDSGEEYEVHGTDSTEFTTGPEKMIRVEGLRDDEYVIVEFPVDAIEHHYTHREV